MIPTEILSYLQICKKHFPGATIAGGAIRDQLYDIEPSDYDFYLPYKQRPGNYFGHITAKRNLFAELKKEKDILFPALSDKTEIPRFKKKEELQKQEREASLVNAGFDVVKNDLIDNRIDFIFIKCSPEKFIREHFDIGLCEIWLDDKGQLQYTEAFMEDYENETLTIRIKPKMTGRQITGSMLRHLPKMKAKFPNHEIRFIHENLYSRVETEKIRMNPNMTNNPQYFKLGTRITAL